MCVCVCVCVCVSYSELIKQTCSTATLMRPGGGKEGAGREGRRKAAWGAPSKTRCRGAGHPELPPSPGLPYSITAPPLASCLQSSPRVWLFPGFLSFLQTSLCPSFILWGNEHAYFPHWMSLHTSVIGCSDFLEPGCTSQLCH